MWTMLDSPAGPIRVIARDGAVTSVEFLAEPPEDASPHSSMRAAASRSRSRDVGDRADDDPLLAEAARQLRAYFARELKEFDLPLRPAGTDFQQRVWRQLLEIGYGETASYGEIARRVGHPDSSRAVGAANGRNPLAIVVPCHRVIGSDGSLTGYAGGLVQKRALLSLEAGGWQDTLL
jgi:methylated-DNA-[protein]-cysteine S-methyltransferase